MLLSAILCFCERNIRGFAEGFCISAVPNTEILLMLSFGEHGRYSAASEVRRGYPD